MEDLYEEGQIQDFREMVSNPYNNPIMHTKFRHKSIFYPHHAKSEYNKTFCSMVYMDLVKLNSNSQYRCPSNLNLQEKKALECLETNDGIVI